GKDDVRRDLEGCEAGLEEIPQLLFADLAALPSMKDRHRYLAEPFVGCTEHRRFDNALRAVERRLHFGRGDILAAAQDDVLLAVDDEQITVFVEVADVAGL